MHIMDLVQNSLTAGATRVEICIGEDLTQNHMVIEIQDNGHGIPKEMLGKVADPFTTSRKTRPVGLGLSLLKEAAERCGGGFWIESSEGRGTKVRANFQHDHIDRAPLGDIGETLAMLIAANPNLDFHYEHGVGEKTYSLDTRKMREVLGNVSIAEGAIMEFVKDDVRNGLKEIGAATFPGTMEVLK